MSYSQHNENNWYNSDRRRHRLLYIRSHWSIRLDNASPRGVHPGRACGYAGNENAPFFGFRPCLHYRRVRRPYPWYCDESGTTSMKRILLQFGVVTGIVCLLPLIAMLVMGRPATDAAEALLDPWFVVCSAITPDSWETQGNIIMGLIWVVSGAVAYSILISTALVVVWWALGGRQSKHK